MIRVISQRDSFGKMIPFRSASEAGIKSYNTGVGWGDIDKAIYAEKSIDISDPASTPYCVQFKPDNSKLYVLDSASGIFYQYSVPNIRDIRTITLDGSSSAFIAYGPTCFKFSSDGTKILFGGNSSRVRQLDVTTAWDVTSGLAYAGYYQIATGTINGIELNSDDTKMVVLSGTTGRQYTLSTPGDITDTVTDDSVTFDFSSYDSTPTDIKFGKSFSKLYLLGSENDAIQQFTLGTKGTIDSVTADGKSFEVLEQAASPYSVAFNSFGSGLCVADTSTGSIYQFNL